MLILIGDKEFKFKKDALLLFYSEILNSYECGDISFFQFAHGNKVLGCENTIF